jgi:hypothetical protein
MKIKITAILTAVMMIFTACSNKGNETTARQVNVNITSEKPVSVTTADDGLREISLTDIFTILDKPDGNGSYGSLLSPIASVYIFSKSGGFSNVSNYGINLSCDKEMYKSNDGNGGLYKGNIDLLKNGDTVTLTAVYDKEKLKQAGVKLSSDMYTFTLENIPQLATAADITDDIVKNIDSAVISSAESEGVKSPVIYKHWIGVRKDVNDFKHSDTAYINGDFPPYNIIKVLVKSGDYYYEYVINNLAKYAADKYSGGGWFNSNKGDGTRIISAIRGYRNAYYEEEIVNYGENLAKEKNRVGLDNDDYKYSYTEIGATANAVNNETTGTTAEGIKNVA